jgi:phosphoglycolate phosphatase
MAGDLLIFDFDGTLADTWRDIATGLNRTLSEAGLAEATGSEVRDWVGRGVRVLIARAIAADDPARIEALYQRFRVHYADCCLDTTLLYAGMRAALDALTVRHRLAILSNKPQFFLDRIVEGLAIRPLFATVVGGDALPVSKPDPATIAHVVTGVGVAPATAVWMIGDSDVDVDTGRAFGARTIGCAWGLRPRAELERAGAEIIIAAPAELPPLLA